MGGKADFPAVRNSVVFVEGSARSDAGCDGGGESEQHEGRGRMGRRSEESVDGAVKDGMEWLGSRCSWKLEAECSLFGCVI